jgi:multidrug efflux pump subunit AcrB
VQLGDVASVKDSVETVRPYANLNGEASIALAILRQLGANTVRVVDSATHVLVKIKEHAKVVRQRPDRYCHERPLLLIGIVKKNAIMVIDSMATDPSPRPGRFFPEFQPPM